MENNLSFCFWSVCCVLQQQLIQDVRLASSDVPTIVASQKSLNVMEGMNAVTEVMNPEKHAVSKHSICELNISSTGTIDLLNSFLALVE